MNQQVRELSNLHEDVLVAFSRELERKASGVVRWVSRIPPPSDWIKVSFFGSSLGNQGQSGCGGLLRDSNGIWIVGFSLHVGFATNMVAELSGMRQELQLAWELSYKKVII